MNSQEPFKREYGFLYIVTPEDKAKCGPKLSTDEFLHRINGHWATTDNDGRFGSQPYRRRISPGPDHEIVPLDGVPDDYGCEMFCRGEWKPFANRSKQTVEAWLKSIPEILAIRRPISKPVESGWVSVDTAPKFYSYQVYRLGLSGQYYGHGCYSSGQGWLDLKMHKLNPQPTHWFNHGPIPLPPKTQPPRPAAEVACDEAWEKQDGFPHMATTQLIFQAGFRAALDWAKSHLSELSKEGK